MLQFDIITIFPKIFDSYLSESILKRGQKKKQIKIKIHDLRDFTFDKHKTVDDRPYGGGPGMILKVEPIYKCLKRLKTKGLKLKAKVVLLSPAGKKFNQKIAQKFSKLERIILICGRYEGVDARVEKFIDEKISIGHYVLSGGELPAMVIIEAVSRLIPGVLGKYKSLEEETFSMRDNKCEYPQYTRPEVFLIKDSKSKVKKLRVPKVLLSGNHQKIKEWRIKHSKE